MAGARSQLRGKVKKVSRSPWIQDLVRNPRIQGIGRDLRVQWRPSQASQNVASNAVLLPLWKVEQKMQQAAISFIVSQLASKDEMMELQKAFKALDKNSDGKLSREELVEGYRLILGDLAEEEVDRILKAADTDGSGEIDYSEWIVATTDKKRLLTDEKLQVAFKVFDKDGGGSISSSEIKETLGVGRNIDERVWNEIVKEVDPNGDGEISFDEFKLMMTKLLEVEIKPIEV